MLDQQLVDYGCDLWALGIIIYKLYTGKYLFEEANDYLTFERIKQCEFAVEESVPEELSDLIKRLVVKEPHLRLGNGKEGSDLDFNSLK